VAELNDVLTQLDEDSWLIIYWYSRQGKRWLGRVWGSCTYNILCQWLLNYHIFRT